DLATKGLKVVGVPKTIDNDLAATNLTFGFMTAVETATDAIDKLHSTAEAHERVMVVELMGRHAGWIALFAGVAGTADVILIPEIPYSMDSVCEKIEERWARGREFAIVVVAEGAYPVGGEPLF
ncbi:MAG: 6-phosphofructokinase, partial [Gemmatimonadetes bacterium]|nr:6-phosphofructokinase [Gemmatimonadota bacterium]NIV61700.1 6-phosphofructokinase [Gemmatimonadota bacterium]NIW64413.1 6-phosphofructokinase [Gemmatimonadota bacterium]NIY07865.1 6-phosphofructokinase [Gemmatimonadota bacterium]